MIHKYDIYYFISHFDSNEILNLDKRIKIIFRNYEKKNIEKEIQLLSIFCKKNNRQLFISNNLKIAIKYNLDGLYLPSFNKSLKFKNLNLKKKFKIIGSAHNRNEIILKEKQGCHEIFVSPIFYISKNKNYLGIIKFNLLNINTKQNIIALGGLNEKNYRKLKSTRAKGFAGISWIKKTGLRN